MTNIDIDAEILRLSTVEARAERRRSKAAREVREARRARLALEETKGRAGGAARQVDETGNGCRISKSKVASRSEARKSGVARRDDIEGRVRTLARKMRVTPELEGGAR